MTLVDGLPDLRDNSGSFRVYVHVVGLTALVRGDRFFAHLALPAGTVDWLVERPPFRYAASAAQMTRRINAHGDRETLWADDRIVAELRPGELGGAAVVARDAATGTVRWEHEIPIPDAAAWAEVNPAWSGAATEEIYSFLANDPTRLVVGLARHTRRSMMYSREQTADSLPAFACQTDLVRLDPATGEPVWRATFPDVHVGILERKSFTGHWAHNGRVGRIDLETGTNTVLHESPHSLGWPVRDGPHVAVPWHSQREIGVDWVDDHGRRARTGSWAQSRVSQTRLWVTADGLALQTNDQSLWWLGRDEGPAWNVRAKPYIYRVHRAPGTDVFVGTDGNGGRLFGFDVPTGRETLNLRPALGGLGTLAKVPGHDVLAATYCVSRSWSVPPRLLVLNMRDRRHEFVDGCSRLLGTWEHGLVCQAGPDGNRLAVVDVRALEGFGS